MDDHSDDQSLNNLADCLERVRAGDLNAVAELYERYFDRSVRLARSRLTDGEGRIIDEEEAAVSALDSLIFRVQVGNYGDLRDHLELWRILAKIVDRKVTKYRRKMYGKRRSAGKPLLSVDAPFSESSSGSGQPLLANEPSPISLAIANDTLQNLIDHLGDSETKMILLMRLEGFTDIEIADRMGHSRQWVARRGMAIRRIASSLLKETE